MVKILNLILAFIGGFAAHKLSYHKTLEFNGRWGMLMRYAIGYICTMPFRILLGVSMMDKDRKKYIETAIISDLLTGLMFGSGVFIGHFTDKD